MSDIYVYSANCDDFTNFGLVGALTPTSCIFEEVANGLSEITLEHPIDALGRYKQLVTNNLLMVEVPVRTTPEIEGNNIVTSVEKWTVSKTASKANRTMYKKRTGNTKIKVLSGGSSVTMVKNYADGRCKIKCKYGTGFVEKDGLEDRVEIQIADNSQSIESVEPAWTVKPQIFRIYSVEKGLANVTVMARHISYDLMYNLTIYKNKGAVACAAALDGIMGNCVAEHDFAAYTNLMTARTGIDWTRTNPIDALLNPENGLTTRYGASLVRDNWELYVLHDPGLNRGVTVEYGKNMTGITYTESFESVVTRIIPVGETKDGNPLILSGDTPWVDSPKINDYPIVYAQKLICSNCKVGEDVDSNSKAYAEMKKQANAVFENGGDLPTVEMSVEFVNLGDTAEYDQFKDLERLFLWDYVLVKHKLHNINVTARIVSIRWNCLLERMETMEIGSVGKTLANSGITSWQIPAGISGAKIADGTIGNAAFMPDIISARHLQADSVNADALQAESVTADKIAAGAVNAKHIAAGSITADMIDTEKLEANVVDAVIGEFDKVTVDSDLYASFAHIIELAAQSINAGSVTTDKLAAALAEVISLQAKTGDFDLATVQNLLSEALILQQGQAGSMMITNLAVTSANLLNATIGELVLKGSDGQYYRVYVGADGTIHTEVVTVSEGEIDAGQTTTGRQIVDTMANIGSLNAQNIKVQSAIIDTIVTTALDAGKITASEALIASATIPALYTTAITAIGNSLDLSANEYIKLMVARKSATYYRDTEPEDATAGDTWIYPEIGKTYIAKGMTGKNTPEFYVSADFDLMYRFGDDADDFAFRISDDGSLMATNEDSQVDDNGELLVKNRWVELVPSELHTSYIDIAQDRILVNTGGNIKITAGGKLDVNAGAAHFTTPDYTLSILAGDGTEDTVLDFDSESKTLRVDEVNANNVRPYIPGVTAVTATAIGGLDGLANMLSAARYEHVVYTQDEDDYSTSPVVIEGSDTIQVDIVANFRFRIAPLSFKSIASNVWIENVKWECASETAIAADSGNIRIKNCVANAENGVVAERHANVTWIGADNSIDSAGVCTADAFRAVDGATIRANGMIPSGGQNKTTGGVLEMIDTYVGSGGSVAVQEEITETISATFGYFGTESYWNAGELFQGFTNAKGQIYGCIKFNLPSDITIVSAALTLKSKASIGTGANVNVSVYGSETTYGNRPTLGTKYISKSGAVAAGQSCSLDATNAVSALIDGTAKQLVLYTGETAVMSGKTYSKHYAQFSGAKLKITYRRNT